MSNLKRRLTSIVVCAALWIVNLSTNAEDLLVFVSAFAPGDQGAIHAFRLDVNSGQLKQVHRTTDVEHPFFMAISPRGKYLYSIHAEGQFGGESHEEVAAYQILDRTGQLKLLNRQSALGTAACYLDVDATGKTVVVANYSTGSVASLPVKPDGSLGRVASFVQHQGSSVNPQRQAGPHAHCIVISPDNRFAYAADLGLDQVVAYRLQPTGAQLAPHRQPFIRTPPGAGPRHLTFHPHGKQVYVINELTNSVTVFDYTESGLLIEQQTISTLPEGFDGTSYCADVKITPNGRFLYGTNRGHHSVAAYRIAEDGRLSLLSIEPSLGDGPQNLAITPGGQLLLCANMPGDNLIVFRINPETGKLTPVGEPVKIPKPSCIMILK